jgi:ribonuclease J
MSQIKFYALGGLGENGKNLYCLEIDKKIIILDAGLKHPSGDLLGVDMIVPDISYLEARKADILGIFISHAHDKHIGAIPLLLSTIDIPVYGTNYAIAILADLLKESKMDPDKYRLRVIPYNETVSFYDFQIMYFTTSHSIPESCGIGVLTKDGAIVYVADYTFDQNGGPFYQTDFSKIAKLRDYGVLALMSESGGVLVPGHATQDNKLVHLIKDTIAKTSRRLIVSMYSTELLHIQRVINEAIKAGKSISIIGRKAQRMVDIGETMGYIKIPADRLVSLKYIDESNDNELDNVVFLVTGERHEPFFMLQRMAKGFDRLLKITEKDTILMLCPPVIGTEKIAAKTYDILYRLNVNLIRADRKIMPPSHAAQEDIKLLYSLLQPKYIVPVTGEYRYQMGQYDLAVEYGYPQSHVALIDNGEVITFSNGELELRHDTVMNGNIMVDGSFDADVNESVLKERELLSQDGFLMILANIDARERLMLNKPEIVSRGFMYMKDNEEVIKKIEEIYAEVTEKQFKAKFIDWRVYKESISFEVQRYLFRETKRKPIVIPVIIDTQSDKICKVL